MSPTFLRGDLVEVICSDDGFTGAYYPASVLSLLPNGNYMVQYSTLLRDDELGPLREIVSAAHLRPIPPPSDAEGFAVGEKVDAYANDGWWAGEVVRRRPGRARVYEVLFESCGEVGDYGVKDLRLHREWSNGKWFRSGFH